LYRKKDGVDIDNYVEYEKFMKKIIDKTPSKLIVYLDLIMSRLVQRYVVFYVYLQLNVYQSLLAT